ncbi:hypothetical protein FQA39_LY11983 [Lamprigera yunnana]|nr:hypothetical protein FQA39_LY11983 [Lamprigera yunnana]
MNNIPIVLMIEPIEDIIFHDKYASGKSEYRRGCPKNQNKCWYRIGSPPPTGSKNDEFKFRSVNNIVIAPASTGKDRRSRIAVITTAQTNKGIRSRVIPVTRILITVEIKLIAPKIDEIPAKWNNGGYTVHPVPAPFSIIDLLNNKVNEGGSNQNLILFIRGNAISGAPSINGINQFPKPPIIIGLAVVIHAIVSFYGFAPETDVMDEKKGSFAKHKNDVVNSTSMFGLQKISNVNINSM